MRRQTDKETIVMLIAIALGIAIIMFVTRTGIERSASDSAHASARAWRTEEIARLCAQADTSCKEVNGLLRVEAPKHVRSKICELVQCA